MTFHASRATNSHNTRGNFQIEALWLSSPAPIALADKLKILKILIAGDESVFLRIKKKKKKGDDLVYGCLPSDFGLSQFLIKLDTNDFIALTSPANINKTFYDDFKRGLRKNILKLLN
jgi:hypothetical protein